MKHPAYQVFLIGLLSLFIIPAKGQIDSTAYKLESMVKTLIAQDQFNGAILYAKGDNILYEKYHGLKHPFKKEPITAESSFNLASISKQFFGMALMLLYEEGKIDFDAPLKKYLMDFPNEVLTVRQLVTQTSGLKEYFGETIQSYSTNHLVENEDVYATMLQLDTLFNFPPGDAYQYSNTNYIFLAILIEKVAGIPIEQFLENRIFTPLQLNNTFAYHLKRDSYPDNRVFGMDKTNTTFYLNDLTPLDGVIGDGNLYSTPRDLRKWVLALDKNILIKSETQALAWQPQKLNNDTLSYYGFGWRIDKATGHYVHTGGWVGFGNIIRFDPISKAILVVLNSNSNFQAAALGQSIFLGQPYELADYQLISNVQVVDGTGLPAYPADVRLKNNRIYEIGDLTAYPNEKIIDGKGKILCPGFIDSHSHHDYYYTLKDEGILPAISQGITTIITGQDGSSHFPLDTFFAQFEAAPASINLASYVGHNTLRLEVMGRDSFQRRATNAELAEMATLLERELKSGALGMSAGLEYDPGIFSNTK
jgi:CubicO group peptidase (beta-lactamase class C family)